MRYPIIITKVPCPICNPDASQTCWHTTIRNMQSFLIHNYINADKRESTQGATYTIFNCETGKTIEIRHVCALVSDNPEGIQRKNQPLPIALQRFIDRKLKQRERLNNELFGNEQLQKVRKKRKTYEDPIAYDNPDITE